MKILHKTVTFQCKAVDDEQGLIEAYGSVFDNVDQGDDMVRPGAFKRTIQNSKSRVKAGKSTFLIPMLWQHDANQPIGGWYDLGEDAHGLKAKGKIILSTKLGQDIYNLIKEGVLDQFSIGYDIPQGGASYNAKEGYRELKELRLWEISVVTFAMNTEALLTGVKSHDVLPGRKDFYDHYRQETIEDWLYSDFRNLLCSLKASLIDAFMIGDSPQEDLVTTILQENGAGKMGFIAALEAWVQKGIDLDASCYLQETLEAHGPQGSPATYGGYMSRQEQEFMEHKAGRAISQSNMDKVSAHIANVKDMSNKALQASAQHFKAMQEHVKSMNAAADDLATQLQGSEAAYGTDAGTPAAGQDEGKSAPVTHSSKDTEQPTDTDFSDALAKLRNLRKSIQR